MLRTIEVEIDSNGHLRLLEPLNITKPTRALLTLLENGAPTEGSTSESDVGLLAFLDSPQFVNRKIYSAEVMEDQIQENRNSWE